MSRQYFVYLLSSVSRTLYVGVTSDLRRRVYQHKHKLVPGFTSRYNLTRRVYFEATSDVRVAFASEKEIRAWRRKKKIKLIEASNPTWRDLKWFDDRQVFLCQNIARRCHFEPASVPAT